MTAQVGVLNKIAVALASDSAVTFTHRNSSGERSKIYSSANKLFELSAQHPVGIMIFGQACFFGIPLSNLIKLYSIKMASTKFNTLKEYADDFIEFIRSGYPPPSMEYQEKFMQNDVNRWLEILEEDMFHNDTDKKLDGSSEEVKFFAEGFIHEAWEQMLRYPFLLYSTDEQRQAFWNKYGQYIGERARYFFKEYLVDEKSMRELGEVILGIIFRQIFPSGKTGIVIAGFGEEELYPSLFEFYIDGIGDNKIKAQEFPPYVITEEQDAAVIPFAQKEMVYLFMEGIDSDMEEYALRMIGLSIRKYSTKKTDRKTNDILHNYVHLMDEYKQTHHREPILNMVKLMPENEMAIMAESLVGLTALKRRITMDPGTVGGPVDVAIITKTGFRWVGGKHNCPPGPIPKA